MKQILSLVCFFSLFFSNSYSQSNRFGTISGGVGADLGIHVVGLKTANISTYGSNVGVLIGSFPMELNFGLVKPLSIGVQYAPTKVHLGSTVIGNCSAIGFNVNLYIVNTKRFNMALSVTPGILNFDPFSFKYDANNHIDLKLSGNVIKGRLLFDFYFSDNAGMYLGLGYSSYTVKLEEYTIQLQDPELESELKNLAEQNFQLKTAGVDVSIGVLIKLDIFKGE